MNIEEDNENLELYGTCSWEEVTDLTVTWLQSRKNRQDRAIILELEKKDLVQVWNYVESVH